MWREYFDFNAIQINLMFAGSGVVVSAIQGIVFPFLVKRIGFHSSLLTGISCIAVACAALGPLTVFTQLLSLHVMCLLVFWFGVACMEPGTVVAVSRHLKQSIESFSGKRPLHTGLAMGITSAMKYAASLSIPPLAGHLYDKHRYVAHYLGGGIACLGIIAVVIAARVYQSNAKRITVTDEEKIEENSLGETTETTIQNPEEEQRSTAV
jgi:MFS family permease